jgi:hypothetical protein
MFEYLRTLDLKTVENIADSLGSFVLAVDNADEALRVCSEQFDQGLVTGLRSVQRREAMWLDVASAQTNSSQGGAEISDRVSAR